MSEEIIRDTGLKTVISEIDTVFIELEKAIEERGIARIECENSKEFWGYIIRGYNEKDEEIYTKAIVLGERTPHDDKFRVLAESLFLNSFEALKQLYGV